MTESLSPARSAWPDGAQTIRMRTRNGAPLRGHALLIGAPLAGLMGVPKSLAAMQGWLESRGMMPVSTTGDSEAATIEAQMHALLDAITPGDWVLVYYAGHGMQVLPQTANAEPLTSSEPRSTPKPRLQPSSSLQFHRESEPFASAEPLAVLLPIDAFESRVVITADTWTDWLRALTGKARAPRGEGAGVVLVMDCCHALALMTPWPDGTARAALVDRLHRWLAQGKFRGPTGPLSDPVPGVVRVLATGRDDRADVGEMTTALVRLLHEHPEEPWWALMDRLRAGWTKAQQYPGVTGPVERIPLSHERFQRPVGLTPCTRQAGRWTTEYARAAGWTSHRRLALTPSLRLPPQAWGKLEANGSHLEVIGPDLSPAVGRFAWAWPAPQRPRAVVMVDGHESRHTRALAQRLRPLVKQILEPAPSTPSGSAGLPRFVATSHTVELYDPWGDRVARTSTHDEATWAAWLDRLLSLEDWLAVANQASPWPEGAIQLRWGTWDKHGYRIPWTADDSNVPLVTPTMPLWIEVEAKPWVRAHASLFRIRADRAVECSSARAPGGLPLACAASAGSSLATIGHKDDPLFLPAALPNLSEEQPGDELRTEFLVMITCDRPLPLALLARGPVGSVGSVGSSMMAPSHRYRSHIASTPSLAMRVVPYRVRSA
ncbi:MAG: hypothetical protein AAGF11_38255 [Myxococcota bacterium]